VGVGTGTVGAGVPATQMRSVGVEVGVDFRVGVDVGVRVGVPKMTVPVGVGLGVGDAVGVLPGVKVGTKVGGPVALNAIVALAGWNWKLPAKLAMSGVTPAAVGVMLHEALPVRPVVPVQEFPSKVNLSCVPGIAIGGVTEMSKSEAISVLVLPTVPLLGLRFRVHKVACGPPIHVTCAKLDASACAPTVADATS
jgi:hypothetical protein